MQAGDPCPHCGGKIEKARGIEVGQVFKLYTKYSSSLNATYLDEAGKSQPIYMGCYGIGVSRTMAAAVEQNNDKDGIIWPVEIAPYHVIIVPVNIKDTEVKEKAFAIYKNLQAEGLEVILDDRDERPGVKFKDADLIGYPLRIVVGKKALADGKIELKIRKTGELKMLDAEHYAEEIRNELLSLKK